MRKLSMLGALVLCACGSEDESITCSMDERRGIYTFRATEQSGTCGPLAEEVAVVDDPYDVGECTLLEPDVVSADQCTLNRHYSCPTSEGSVEWVATTRQVADDGSRVEGEGALFIRDGSGRQVCSSTYAITITRQ